MSNPNNSGSGKIFNVDEAQGSDRVQYETTAAVAQAEAPTSHVARQVEANADQAKDAAGHAASAAKSLGPSFTGEPSAVDQLQRQARATTDRAVAEGQLDVEEAKVTGVTYLEQAKALANSALSTAQSYLPASVGGTQTNERNTPNANTSSNIASSVQAGATSAYQTAKEYLTSAHEMGLAAAQPHIDRAKGAAQAYMSTNNQGAAPAGASSGVPATSAPLESGPHTVGTPYPSIKTTGVKVAENENRTSRM